MNHIPKSQLLRKLIFLGLFAAVSAPLNWAIAQEVTPDAPKSTSAVDVSALKAKYDSTIAELRDSLKAVFRAQTEFKMVSMEESADVRKKWRKEVAKADALFEKIEPIAIDLFFAQEEPETELTDLLMRIAVSRFEKGKYLVADKIVNRVLKLKKAEIPQMVLTRGRCDLYLNRFDSALQFASDYGNLINSLPDREKALFTFLPAMKQVFDKELAIRKKEAEADDLPRVEIKTTKGTILVELFENEAPGTVGNFINLIEKGFYTDKVFHRVINHFMAQTGGYDMRGRYHPLPYYIYDECGAENARMHFRGVLSMAKGDKDNTGNGQFFITFRPTPTLDGKHTVFGRVLSGMDVVDQINRTVALDENEQSKPIPGVLPDKIISIKVLRKRDHKYEPDIFHVIE